MFCGDFNDLKAPQFRFNDVWSVFGAAFGGTCTDQTALNGNISADPLFVNSTSGDYHLLQSSPGIDAGNNGAAALLPTDIDDDSRVLDADGDRLSAVDMGADEFAPASGPIVVVLDIKPGTFPNSVNPRSTGVIPAAIVTTDTFDAATIDVLTVKFGPRGATEAHGRGHFEDVNNDNRLDLVLHFRTRETGIGCGYTSASLTGATVDGAMIQGTDSITSVGCR